MITTTLFRREEIYDKKNENKKSKIFTEQKLVNYIRKEEHG